MKLPIHNPARPIGGRKKKKTARARKRRNEEKTMAKKRKKARSKKSSHPKKKRNPVHRAATHHPKRAHARRSSGGHHKKKKGKRRNPKKGPEAKMSPAAKVALAAAAGVGATVLLSVAGAVWAPNSVPVHLGLAGAGVVGGAILAKKRPAVGGAIAAGSVVTVAAPWLTQFLFNKLAPSKATTTTVGAIHEASRGRIGAIHEAPRMGAFQPTRQAPFHAMTPWGAATS